MTRIVRSRTAWQGYTKVIVATCAAADGVEFDREIIELGQAACVLPYDPERRVALIVRLPRAPLLLVGEEEHLIEAPAGMIEAGEDARTCIRREAMEEVGLRLGDLEPVAVVWPSPGVLGERSHLFLSAYSAADRQGEGGGVADEHESISVHEMPLDHLWAVAGTGGLRDMKTLTLVLALKTRHPGLFTAN